MPYYGLTNPDGRNDVIVCTVLGVFSTATTLLRLLSRRILGSAYMLDDYLAIGATIVMILNLCLHVTMVVHGGVGNNIDKVDKGDVEYDLKALIPSQCLYAISLALAKTSLLALYMRIFGIQRWVRIHIWVLAGVIWAWAASTILESFLICRPFAFNWDTSIPGGVCGNRNAAFIAAGALSMMTDVLVIVVPLPSIWALNMTLPRKLSLCLIFCLGFFVSALSIIRMIALGKINFKDVTHSLIKPLLWSIMEIQLAVVVVNLPLLQPIVARLFPFIRFGTSKNNSGHANTTLTGSQHFTRLGDPSSEGYILRTMEISVTTGEKESSQTSLCIKEP